MNTNKRLEINSLKTIKDYLQQMYFFKYSTQKRNIAYLMQLREFLLEIHKTYTIDRGLESMFMYNIIRTNSDIIEGLLYCAIIEIEPVKYSKIKAIQLVNAAKSKQIISKEIASLLKNTINIRNDLHPCRQNKLHVKITPQMYDDSNLALDQVFASVSSFFNPNSSDENEICQYCYMNTNYGEQCLGCGKIIGYDS